MAKKVLAFIKASEKTEKESVIDDLSSLKNFGGAMSKKDGKGKISLGDDEPKKKKEAKKDKKKKKKGKSIIPKLDIPDALGSEKTSADGVKLPRLNIDIDKIAQRFEEGEADKIVGKEKRKYDKRKKDQNPYKKEFAEETTLLYNLYDEVGTIVKSLEKIIKGSEGRRVQGQSKYYNDAVSNLLQAKNSQLAIVDKLTGVKKVMADLKLKDDAAKAKNGENENKFEHSAAAFLQQTMQHGRRDYLRAVRGTDRPSFLKGAYDEEEEYMGNAPMDPEPDEDDIFSDEDGDEVRSYRRQTIQDLKHRVPGYTDEEQEDIRQAIADRLASEGNSARSEKGNKFIHYEKQGVEVIIQRDIDTDDFNFAALDSNGNIVHDYPLPENYGNIKFNGPVANDRYGEAFRVVEYSSMGNPVLTNY